MKKQLYQTANVAIGLFLLLVSLNANAVETAAPVAPAWGFDPVVGTLLSPGISVMTSGTLQNPSSGGGIADGDHALKLYDTRNITPTNLRQQQNPDVHTHHHWDVGSIGNVFGLAIDKNRNIYATASTHWGAGYFNGGAAKIGFGAIGAGTPSETAITDNDTPVLNNSNAAGTIYKIDAITGNATIFTQLPQQAFSFNQGVCEGSAPDIARNTGPALGNIAYDPIHNQFFVSNFEDGKIYRISSAGVTLNSFDPFAADDGTAGLASDARPYGLAVNPDGTKLYFGTHELNLTPRLFAISLDSNGDFSGSEVNQNATLGSDLTYTQSQITTDPWVAYSDLNFSPKGELVIGVRTGCRNNFATSHNHGGTNYLLVQDVNGLYNTPASQVPGNTNNSDSIEDYDAGSLATRFRGDDRGPDDGYGGIAIYDKGTGEFDYLLTTADVEVEAGPHGFILFPEDFTMTGGGFNNFLLRPAAAFSAFPSSTSSSGNDYKGSGGDIEVLSVEMDWGDAPDTYSTDLFEGNAAGGADVRGPSHIIADGIFLGASVDDESNGVPSINANGDDTSDAPDDEDGISAFPALHVNDTSYTIPIANITAANSSGSTVTIHAWIDFDGSGAFDVDEHTSTTVANGATSPSSDLVWQEEVSGMTTGTTSVYSRFRITNDTDLSASTPGGYADNGEVEDYLITITSQDWGDAPDASYPTLLVNDGPRHTLDSTLFMGTCVDDEANGQQSTTANGDDNGVASNNTNGTCATANDDEDSLTPPTLTDSQSSPTVDVTAVNTTGSDSTVACWVDYNGNNTFDNATERGSAIINASGTATVTLPNVPATANNDTGGSTFMRCRIASNATEVDNPTGAATNGEVEDYPVSINAIVVTPSLDWGDAPDASYPTLFVNDGPRHTLDSALFMGTCVDDEANGQQSATANGDDNGVASNNTNGTCATANDDEDSLTPPTLTDSQSSPTVDVTVVNTTGSDSTVACWVDYNGNNTFDNATERGSAVINASGTATVTLPNVPATANDDTGGSTFMRCRIASNATEVDNPTGAATNGEVEDYPISINAVPVEAPTPSIDIEKATNTADADTVAEAVVLNAGDTVTWTFVITNDGNETLNSISANDDKEGAITCPKTTLVVAEPMTCTAKTGAAVVGNYANIASVSGIGITSTTTVNDSDPSHYKVTPTPSIDIEKATNSIDADTEGEAVVLNIGASVTWSFVITNIGNETLNSITANDDLEGAIICPKTTLLAAESMICTAITGTAGTVDYENIASVSGTGAVSSLVVTDNDPSHYRVISPIPTPQDPAKPIPTLSEWGQIILMILMGLVAYNQQVRQRKF